MSKTKTGTKHLAGDDTPAYTPSIATRSITGNVLRTAHSVQAWYVLPATRWSFRSDQARTALMRAIAGQYAELAGRWLHIRVTSTPMSVTDWATAHMDNAHNVLPDVPGALSLDDYLIGEQQQLADRAMTIKSVYLGVEVHTRGLLDRAVERAAPLLQRVLHEAVNAELSALHGELAHLDHIIGAPGLGGRPATAAEMQWLLHRSCTLGLPAPESLPVTTGSWESSDLASFDDAAAMVTTPYAPTVSVRGMTGSVSRRRAQVAVLTLGQMEGVHVPEVDTPWAQRPDRLPLHVEQSGRVYVRRPEEVTGELQRQMNKVRSQMRHYTDEHDLEPPTSLSRQGDRVMEIDDEMTSGFTALATRVKAWWRFAVCDATPNISDDERERRTLQAAQTLHDEYKPTIGIEHPEAQHALAREFIPGESLASAAHTRHTDVVTLSGAMPQATADVGDQHGVVLGETTTATRRPVMWDPWHAQERRDSSGLTALCSGLGGGKSFLAGGLVYKTLRMGARWTILDPSGPLTQLCELPELKPYARPINLLNAEPGILNPYRVVPDPKAEDFLDEEDPDAAWRREMEQAALDRRELVTDVFVGVLPYEIARMPATRIVLATAVRAAGSAWGTNPWRIVEQLRADETEYADHAGMIADALDDMKPRLSLLIPESDEDDPYGGQRDDRLTVLNISGLTLPKDGVDREHWTQSEAVGVQMLNLAAWLTQRSVYRSAKHERKGVWIDEAFFLSSVSSGRNLMQRFVRDSRKWNVRVLLSSQVPADFLRIQGFTSLVDSVFVGRLDDEQTQTDALQLLGVNQGTGYEHVIGGLSKRAQQGNAAQHERVPREFIFHDGTGGVEKVRIDYGGTHLQPLRDALDTSPGRTAETGQTEQASVDAASAASAAESATVRLATGTPGHNDVTTAAEHTTELAPLGQPTTTEGGAR